MSIPVMTIGAPALYALLEDQRCVALIDVRTAAEYRAGHIPGAVLIPLADFDRDAVLRRTERCGVGEEETAVITCESGARAREAAKRLIAAGYSNVMLLDGGTEAWEKHGLPMNRCASPIPLPHQAQITIGALVVLKVLFGFTVHELFFALAALVGAGLIVAGLSRWRGLEALLARMPWNRGGLGSRHVVGESSSTTLGGQAP
ncbi:MAG: hypothetical protein AMJ69_08005 [Gammaproteobacteria bacterium SG8_47]|nr:MAG: hypothetical protein AMJ69_08005 [Gammaproteobacteria bacterium SG8_47]